MVMDKFKPVLALVLLCFLAGAGYYYYRHYYSGPSTQLEASGTIEARSVDLKAKNSGTIRE